MGGAIVGMVDANDVVRLDSMFGVTVGVGLDGGDGLSSRVMVRL